MIVDVFNIIIIMMLATITMMLVSKGSRKICKRYKFAKKRHEVYYDMNGLNPELNLTQISKLPPGGTGPNNHKKATAHEFVDNNLP